MDATDTTTGCTTASRTAVIATIHVVPAITATTPNSGCENGKVTLGATASSGTINWYATATGGVSLGAGTSFTTPNIAATTTYYVEASVTATGCTTGSRTVIVATVNAIPSAPSANNGGAACAGATINLNATNIPGATYLWTGPNGFTSTDQNPTRTAATIAMAGNYSVKATVLGCTSVASSPTVVTVNAIPAAPTVSGNSPVCIGGSINLTASAITGATYVWSGPNGFTSTAQNPVISGVTAAMAGTYSVTATVASCTSNVASISVVVNGTIAPSVTISSNSTSICSDAGGTDVTFTATPINGGLTPSYQWKLNGNNITGATSSLYTTSVLANSSTITVVLTSNASCPLPATATSNGITMVAYAGKPAKPNTPSSLVTSVCPVASGIQISVPAVAGATIYEWNIPTGWKIEAGLGSNTITLSVNGTASTGFNNFQVRAGNACGYSAFSTPAFKVTVDSFAAVNAGSDQTICSGNNVSLSATLLGNAATITWTSSNGGSFSNLNLLTSTFTPNITSGKVTLTATTNDPTGNCIAGTDEVVITVNQPAAITAQPIAMQTLCSGSSATFSVVANGTGLTYQWQKGGVNISGATSATLTLNAITTTADGNYTVQVSGASPCATVTSSTSILKVNQIVAITTQPVSQTLCSGSTVTFNVVAAGTGLTYQWQKAGIDIAGATSASFSINAISSTDAGNYTVKVSGTSPCSAVPSATAVLVVNNGVAITTQPIAQTVCSGSNVTFNVVAAGTGLTYQWQKAGSDIPGATAAALTLSAVNTSDAGNYAVKISGANPCTAVTSFDAAMTVNQIIIITTQPVAQTVCSGSTATFSVAAAGSGLTYQWLKAGNAISGAISSSFSINAVSTSDAGNYSVIVSGVNPCSPVPSATVPLTVSEIVAITTQPIGQTLCSGSSATFNVVATGTSLTYQWKKAGVDIAGATLTDLTLNSISPMDAGEYSVTVNGMSPCAAVPSSKATLVVNQKVSITNQPSDSQTVCSGFPASLSVSATGTDLSYEWFKNGITTGITTSVLNINQTKLSDAGTYRVVVKGASPCINATSNNAVLNINQDIDIITQPTAKVNCEGDTITFEVTATGSFLNYVWRKAGIPIGTGGNFSGETTARLTLTGATLSNAGSYDVVVSGSGAVCAQTISTPALLSLNSKSANPISASATVPVICFGASTILNLTGGGGGTNEVIKWYSDSCGQTAVGTGNGLSVTPATSTTYYGRYENTGTCSYNSTCVSVAVTVNYNSTLNLSSVVGTDAQIKCISNAIIPITYAIGGGGTTASITAGALPTGITGLYSGGIFTINGTPTVAGTFSYTVTTYGPCANVSLSGKITISPLPIATFNYGATTFCKSAANPSLSFIGGGVAGKFTSTLGLSINTSTGSIDLSTSTAGKYKVMNTIIASGGCVEVTHTEEITIDQINVGGSVTGLMDGVAKTVITSCHEGSGILNLAGNTGIVIKWEYSVDGGLNWTADNSNKTNTYNYTGIKATTLYRAAIKSGTCGVAYSSIAFVNVIPPNIKPSPVSASPTILCLGDTSQFTSQSGYGTGQYITGGGFDTGQFDDKTNPDKWRLDGVAVGNAWTASADNAKPNNWAGTSGHPFGTYPIFYDSPDKKFAIANGDMLNSYYLPKGINRDNTTLETPRFNTLGLETFNLEFLMAYNLEVGDYIKVELSLNGGKDYNILLFSKTGKTNSVIFNPLQPFSFALQQYIGQTDLRIKFTFKGTTINSVCAIDNIKLPAAPPNQQVEWKDEKGNIIATTNTVGVKPSAPGIRVYGVTSLINGCRSTGIDGTVFVTINVNYAYAGTDVTISPAECGTNAVSLNAYDNTISAAKNILKGAYSHIAQPNEDPDFLNVSGTGATGKWSIKSSTATCGPGNFSTKNPAKYPDPTNDPDAIFIGDAGTYVLTWTSGACSDDITAILTNCTTVDFDGENDNVTFKNNYDITTDFSIEIWVKPNSVSGTQTIFSKRNANNLTAGYDLKLTGSKISFNWNTSGKIVSPYDISTDRWYHIAVTFNSGTYRLYIDGIEVKNDSGALPGTNSFDCILGAMDQTGNQLNKPVNHFKGWMDELRIWNVALTPEQLHQMMNQGIKSNGAAVTGEVVPVNINGLSWTTNLLGYYRMDVNSCGHLAPSAGTIHGKLRNITTDMEQTAPIPYTSRVDGQDWGTDNTWTHFNVWDAPNSKGVDNSTSIDWNIVETSHSINSGNKDITILGLISKSGELTVADPPIAAPIEKNDGQGLWITLYLKLNGSINLVGESQLVQKRYLPNYFNESILDQTSTGYIERDQQGKRNSYNYNYWSSPVSIQGGVNNAPYSVAGVIKDGTNSAAPRPISFNDWKYAADGALASPIIISNQWIWSYNSPVKSTDIQNYNQWNYIGSTGVLKTGEGFTMKGTGGTATTDLTQNYVFVGKPNNATISLPLPLNQIYLVGNPYPSALDADEFIKNNLKDCVGCTASQNVFNGTLYFWDHFGVTNNHILAEYTGGYAAYNLSGGVPGIANSLLTVHDGSSGSKSPKRYIPVAQGFFVDAPLGSATVTPSLSFSNNQRVFERENIARSLFMKSAGNKSKQVIDARSKIRLGLDSFAGIHRQLLVTADNNTTSGYDIGYDAAMFDLQKNDIFWDINNKAYVIQGINNFNEDQIIPLGITIADKGPITIKIDELENIADNTQVFLYDNLTSSYHNIENSAFTITLETGAYKNRFSLQFVNKTLSVEETTLSNEIEVLYARNYKTLIILNKIPDTTVNNVYLINLLGQIVDKWDVEDKNQTRIQIPIKNFASGVYIVKLKTSQGEMSTKIIIK